MADRDLRFENVLSGNRADKRTALIVFPAVVVLVIVVGFAAVAVSRMSSLTTEVQLAQREVQEANKAVEESGVRLRDARADTAVLASPGQGAAVLAAVERESGASGVALIHPEQHALNLYAFNLAPAPAGREYRLIVTDAAGQDRVLAALAPDDRGAAYVLARDVPEGATRVEVALLSKGSAAPGSASVPGAPAAGAQQGQRVPVLTGELPRVGEAGVVAAAPQQKERRVQGRAPVRR